MAILYTSSDNQTVLKTFNGVYTIESPDGDLVMRRGNGSEYVESTSYAYTALEPKADGNGYVAILTFSNGRVSIREFDAAGVLQDFTAPKAVDDVIDQEAALNIDIDGDGVIGAEVTYVEQEGSVQLKTVNSVYTIESPDGDLVMRRGNGSEYVESSRYAYTAVEPKADGNGYVAILTFSDGQVSIREFDASGVLQDFTAPQAVDDVIDQEAALNIDIDSDGEIGADVTYVEQQGDVALKTVDGVYTIESPDGDLVIRRGNGSEYVESSRYAYTAVESKADGDGYVAILTFSNGQVSIREFDATGVLQNFTAPQAVTDVVDQEATLNIDIDGDGVIGAEVTYVEQEGSVQLKTVNGVYTIESPDGDLVMRRGNGSEYVESTSYAYTAVEPKADGNGYMAILTFSNGRVSIREFDATGTLQDYTAPQAVADVIDQEATLNIDIDGDGVIGAEVTYVEQEGSVQLKTVNGVYTIESPDGDLVMRRGNSSEYVESTSYAYTAVEPKADGNGYMAVLTFSNGRVSIREFDATGTLQDYTAPQAVADVIDQEAALNIDIDGDGVIGAEPTPEPLDDHGDVITDATATELGTSADGTIEIVSDKDFFAVELEEGQRYLFQMTPEDLDTASLDLYSPNGSYVDYDSDRDLAQFSYVAERSGTYYLKASESGDDDTGNYSVMVDTVTLDDDHGDVITDATAIELGTSADGTIEIVSDKDFFAVELEEGQRYLFQMTPEDLNLDTASLDLYSPNGSYVDYDSDRDLAQFSYVAERSGTYYLKASESGDDDTGNYSVMVDTVTLDDDHGDVTTDATAIELGTSADGTIEIVSDKDFFAVELEEGQRYLFQMTPEDLNLDTASLDLYSPNGSYVDYDSDRDLAQFSYVAERSGTYYLKASESGDDDTGNYSVMVDTVTLDDDHGDVITDTTAIELGTSADGTIEIVSDKDFFAVELEEGQRYLFQMTPEDLDTASLDLYSPNGSYVDYDSDRDLALFSYVAERSGTYYLKASESGDDDTGNYSVMVDTVTLDDDHGDVITDTTAIELGTSADGTIEIVSDKDFFAVELEEGQRYLFQMTPEDLDTASLDLYSPNGSYVDYDSDRDLALFSYVAERSGTYYLKASESGDDDTGDYSVLVEEVGIATGDDGVIA